MPGYTKVPSQNVYGEHPQSSW